MANKSFDMRVINRYMSPQSMEDLNAFMEKMPGNAGKTALIAGGIVWAIAAVLGLNMFMQSKQLVELRAELQKAEALKPVVPTVTGKPADATALGAWVTEAKQAYTGLDVSANGNTVTIQSRETGAYAQFRESISHVMNGGPNWKANIDTFCLGRECDQYPLRAILKIDVLSIDKPAS